MELPEAAVTDIVESTGKRTPRDSFSMFEAVFGFCA